jgi:hypothetical protein
MQISVTSAHGGINIAMWAGAVRTTPVPSTATARKSRRSLSGGSSAWPSRPPLRTISLSKTASYRVAVGIETAGIRG